MRVADRDGTAALRAGAALPPPAEVLGSIPLFAGLDPAAVDELAGATETFALCDGERLFAQNDPGDGAYLLVSGTLVASARTPGDGLRELARVGPGGVIGEFSLLDGGRRSAEAKAAGEVRGYRLDYERFSGLRAGRRPGSLAVLARLRAEVARRIAATIVALEPSGVVTEGPSQLDERSAEPAECARLLGLFPGFDRFSQAEWDAVAARARRLEVSRGTVLAASGARRGALYIVGRGALREATGSNQLLVHGPGSLAGCAGLIEGGEWPSRLEAREEAIVFAFPSDALEGDLASRLNEMVGAQLTRDLRRLSRVGNRALDPALVMA